jgi:hypothetical protein
MDRLARRAELVLMLMDLSSINLSSQRLFLTCFSPDDAIEVFETVTPAVTSFMGFEPTPSLEAFEQIWQTWFPMMHFGNDGHFCQHTAQAQSQESHLRQPLPLSAASGSSTRSSNADGSQPGMTSSRQTILPSSNWRQSLFGCWFRSPRPN